MDLMSDINMVNMVESMKRGGLCFAGTKRQVNANKKYLENCDPSKPSTYIMNFDANSLYGGTMCEPLPYADLKI